MSNFWFCFVFSSFFSNVVLTKKGNPNLYPKVISIGQLQEDAQFVHAHGEMYELSILGEATCSYTSPHHFLTSAHAGFVIV